MKRLSAAILAILYFSTSMGATLHLHYCMGKLVSMGLAGSKSSTCVFCGMPKKTSDRDGIKQDNGCCKDEQKQVKATDDQKLVQPQGQILKLFPAVVISNYAFSPAAFPADGPALHPPANGPPPAGNLSVFLLNRNFRL